MLILDLWGVGFLASVVFGLGKDFLFRYIPGRCENEFQCANCDVIFVIVYLSVLKILFSGWGILILAEFGPIPFFML